MRCIKRNIGHLCHDEPREADSKKTKTGLGGSAADDAESQSDMGRTSIDQASTVLRASSFDGSLGAGPSQSAKSSFDAAALGRNNPIQLVQPSPLSGIQGTAISGNMNQCTSPCSPFAPLPLSSFSRSDRS